MRPEVVVPIDAEAERILRVGGSHAVNPSTLLEKALAVYSKWLHLPDPGPVEIMLGTIAANRMEGDPLWLLAVGAPGCGKTEMLQSVTGLPNVHLAGTLTEAALLSGTAAKERSKESKGGLLRAIGDFGFILCKDFGSVLSMHRDARAAVLAALREVYDGNWTRHVGVDGGRTLAWSGKVAVIAGCTPSIDGHHSVMAAMGERFILYRLPPTDERKQARRALQHAGLEKQMRQELVAAVSNLFGSIRLPDDPEPLDDADTDRLIALTTFAVRARSAVERDGHTREIELIPDPEAPGRLALALARLWGGLRVIGCGPQECWRLVRKAAMDCMPAIRRTALDVMTKETTAMDTTAVATEIRYPTQTTRRALEDLTAHGLVTRRIAGLGKADLWLLSDWSRDQLREIEGVPEMSGDTQ